MAARNPHDASGQLSGYLYQVLSALLLLLETGGANPEAQICVERFDDISFMEDDNTPLAMIQTKHQLRRPGILLDTSIDLWRTINSWCDAIKTNHKNTKDTDFIIITTAHAKDNTATSFLKKSNRNWKQAFKVLNETAQSDNPESNQSFYASFLSLDIEKRQNLVKHIFVCDNAPRIDDIQTSIMPYIRTFTMPDFEKQVYEKIIGWWINNVISCLKSIEPLFISYWQLRKEMFDVGSEYKADSLPIDVDPYYQPTEEELNQLSPEKRIFIEQLILIELSNEQINRCIKDYYNAYQQRSQWVRQRLMFVNDMTKYEMALIDEWNRLFLIMKRNLEDCGLEISEKQKCSEGRKLFEKIEGLNMPIKKNVGQPFIMRGTFHDLANRQRIGWHVDFMERLYQLLKVTA